MIAFDLFHLPAHDLVCFRWNTKTDTAIQYSAASVPIIKRLHKKLFGYDLRAMPHNGKRGRYQARHEVEKMNE